MSLTKTPWNDLSNTNITANSSSRCFGNWCKVYVNRAAAPKLRTRTQNGSQTYFSTWQNRLHNNVEMKTKRENFSLLCWSREKLNTFLKFINIIHFNTYFIRWWETYILKLAKWIIAFMFFKYLTTSWLKQTCWVYFLPASMSSFLRASLDCKFVLKWWDKSDYYCDVLFDEIHTFVNILNSLTVLCFISRF